MAANIRPLFQNSTEDLDIDESPVITDDVSFEGVKDGFSHCLP